MRIIRNVFFYLIVMLGLVSAGTALAEETYTISVELSYNGNCTVSSDQAAPDDKITVTVTPDSNYGAYAVEFLEGTVGSNTIPIPGHPITRSYDNPNQFTFTMPAQNVWLKVTCMAKVPIRVNSFYVNNGIKEGTATPASADNSVAAQPWIYTDRHLAGTSTIQGIFTAYTDGTGTTPLPLTDVYYLYRFKGDVEDDVDYGTVSFENNQLNYTPSAEAAGKDITICLKAICQGSVSEEVGFPVKVGPVPDPAKDQDATLSKLTYSIDGGQPVEIALTAEQYAYEVALPYGTPLEKPIALSGTSTSEKATIGQSVPGNTSYAGSTATLTVQAEDPSVTQQYSVDFIVQPPDNAPWVEIGGRAYEDGDEVLLTVGQKVELSISHGSGAKGYNSASAIMEGIPSLSFQGSWWGYYPNTIYFHTLAPKQVGEGTLTVYFYDERTNDVTGLKPAETIVLTVRVQPAPYVPTPPSIAVQALPSGTVGAAYDFALSAGGDPCAWSAEGLPEGLSLEGSRIGGAPVQAGVYEVTLIARNGGGSDQRKLRLVVYPAEAERELSLNAQYLLLAVGQSARLAPQQADYAALPAVWAVEGEAVTAREGLVTAVKPGLATVRCTVDVGGGQTRTATCRVDVTEDLLDVSGAVLERKKLTVPIYKEEGARLDIALSIPGNRAKGAAPLVGAVRMAAFTEDNAADEYTIQAVDDRTYVVRAKEGARRRVSAIAITLADGRVITTKKLTLAPSKKLPAVEGTLALTDGQGTLALTGAQVKSVKLMDKPNWLDFDESTLEARLTGDYEKNAKLTVQVKLEGWTRPLTVKAAITRQKKADKPVLKTQSVTLFANDVYSTAQAVIESGIEILRVDCESKKFAVTDLGGGLVRIAFQNQKVPKKGQTLKLMVYRAGEEKPVSLRLKVKIAR